MSPIKLFDINSTLDPPTWSPNIWQTRIILNYKQIPYRTEWLDIADVASTLSSIGMPKTTGSPLIYTCPSIIDDSESDKPPTMVSDTRNIAEYLEAKRPEPSINYGSADQEILGMMWSHMHTKMFAACIGNSAGYLEGKSLEYCRRTRREWFGCEIEEMYDTEEKKKSAWVDLEKGLNVILSKAPAEGKHGWIFGSDKPIYEDFVLVGGLCWFKACAPDGHWERMRGLNGGRWARHYDGFKDYMQVDKPSK